ncbi:hypothetical protein GCM10022206_73550 [Streptomyces chiangmaiensis]
MAGSFATSNKAADDGWNCPEWGRPECGCLARPQSGEHRTIALADFATDSDQTDQAKRNEVLFRGAPGDPERVPPGEVRTDTARR